MASTPEKVDPVSRRIEQYRRQTLLFSAEGQRCPLCGAGQVERVNRCPGRGQYLQCTACHDTASPDPARNRYALDFLSRSLVDQDAESLSESAAALEGVFECRVFPDRPADRDMC